MTVISSCDDAGVVWSSVTITVKVTGPVGWFDEVAQVSTPVLGPIVAPRGASEPRLNVYDKGGVLGSEANSDRSAVRVSPTVTVSPGKDSSVGGRSELAGYTVTVKVSVAVCGGVLSSETVSVKVWEPVG